MTTMEGGDPYMKKLLILVSAVLVLAFGGGTASAGMSDGADSLVKPAGMSDGADSLVKPTKLSRTASSGVINIQFYVRYANGTPASGTGARVTLSNGTYVGSCTTNGYGNCVVQFVYYGSGSAVLVNESASVCSGHTLYYSPSYSQWVWTGWAYPTVTLSYAVGGVC